ncbi:hypothetical protein P3C29_25000 [Pseudomonas sp. 1912-s]|uniref:hypothetical protein n=1 Tax=Pseudomonas sp. 1912-s TaxID=3033802 RepID=UPI0023DECD08|nr:hypothetical protein [Pseudomonas sp. 1912-s]MDF3201954.1 hypothetical protein [Pseudomonas sp. 1912-s]
MTDRHANRNDLLNVFAGIAGEFDQVKRQIDRRENVLKAQLKKLDDARKTSPWRESPLEQRHPLQDMAERCQQGLDSQLDAWIRNVENYERNTSFRKDFDDSLLIFVYGKVKAGKSSLGNYLAYGNSAPDAALIDSASPRPEFFWRESTGTAETMSAELMSKQRCFGVDVVEATSSIQGFRLPGMTWVDSPGVHSVNSVNGRLADDYVACADLIVFLSNSSSPGRHSDMNEVVGLLQKKKNLMVLITGSDVIEEDVDDLGNLVNQRVMKARSDRDDQIGYVGSELAKIDPSAQSLLNQINIHSISVRYAEEGGTQEQAQRWQDSGLADFAADIGNIARSSGLALKRQTPLKNLQAFCIKLVESTDQLEKELVDIRTGLSAARKDLKLSVDHILSQLRKELPGQIEKYADQYAMNDQAFSEACRKLLDHAFQHYASELCDSIGQKFENIEIHDQAVGPVAREAPQFSERVEKIKFDSRRNESFGRAGGAGFGAWGGAEGGAALGTLIMPGVGTVIGGLIGGALGAWAGNKAGGAAGEYFNTTEEIEVAVGDNRDEVSLGTREQLLELAENRLNVLYEQLDQLCFIDIADWLKNFHSALKEMRQHTLTQIQEIEKELSHGIA